MQDYDVTFLGMLSTSERRFRDFQELGINDKTIRDVLDRLERNEYVKRDEAGVRPIYRITDRGKMVLLQEITEGEDDTEVIRRSLMKTALRRGYYALYDLRYITSRPVMGVSVGDKARLNEISNVIKDLYLKHDPEADAKRLAKEERAEIKLGLMEFLSGGFVWGPRLVRRGLKERIDSLERLTLSLADSAAKEAFKEAIAVARDILAKISRKVEREATKGKAPQ